MYVYHNQFAIVPNECFASEGDNTIIPLYKECLYNLIKDNLYFTTFEKVLVVKGTLDSMVARDTADYGFYCLTSVSYRARHSGHFPDIYLSVRHLDENFNDDLCLPALGICSSNCMYTLYLMASYYYK